MQTTRRQFIHTTAAAVAAGLIPSIFPTLAFATDSPTGGAHPPFPIRECYCPAHFGNAYEAMGPREMAAYLAEMKWMGFNRYGDWITTTDICNPYTTNATWDLAMEQLDRKKKAFLAAQNLGLGLNLIVTSNHVYLDQLRPDYAAVKNQKIFGQLICPSHPTARKIILQNFERWFTDFAASGIRLSAFTAFAYDYGGCACKKCQPWILTFARLARDIHTIARRHYPEIEPWFCSWWWTPEEHILFNDWAAREAPGWLKGMTLHIEYNKTIYKDVAVPAGCRKIAFLHIGYPDSNASRDIYGKWGPVVAPQRIPETLDNLAKAGAEGFQAYSEGVFDDCNKMLLAGIGSAHYRNAEESLRDYARRYFGAHSERAGEWAHWLAAWGDRTQIALPGAKDKLGQLAQGVPATWRLEQWQYKVALETLDRAIGRPKDNEWSPEKLALAEEFWATQERLYREVYRLGPVRHVLNPRFTYPAWYDSWQKTIKNAPTVQNLQPEA